ncbi:MAG: substrate-binding domain-containing protein [Christensenellaceae bacterium]|nr:substrate-binding domain-containing protein [Christensenellaceae bacterium]
MKKLLYPLLILIICLFLIVSCVPAQPELMDSVPTAEPSSVMLQPRSDEKYVAISCMSSYEYFTDHRIGFTKACQELGVDFEYLAPMENDIEAMKKHFFDAIDQGVDGIVVFGASDELGEMIDLAWEAGIPCVTIDGDIEDSKRIAFVGTDSENAGEYSAQIAIRELGPKGRIIILTELEMALHQARTQAALNYFESYPNVEVLTLVETGASTDTAYDAAIDALQEYPDTDLILCTDYFGGAAAAAAVEELGKVGEIKIISMDRSSYVLKKIEEGVITATVMQQTALMPYYAMRILYDYNNPGVTVVADKERTGVTGVPSEINTGVFVIDKNNYEYFTRN